MNEESHEQSSERERARLRWMEDLQAALDRTGTAVRSAWDSTREERLAALEAAKQAVKEMGEVLEKGLETARERWESETETEDAGEYRPADPTPDDTARTSPDEGSQSTGSDPEGQGSATDEDKKG